MTRTVLLAVLLLLVSTNARADDTVCQLPPNTFVIEKKDIDRVNIELRKLREVVAQSAARVQELQEQNESLDAEVQRWRRGGT